MGLLEVFIVLGGSREGFVGRSVGVGKFVSGIPGFVWFLSKKNTAFGWGCEAVRGAAERSVPKRSI